MTGSESHSPRCYSQRRKVFQMVPLVLVVDCVIFGYIKICLIQIGSVESNLCDVYCNVM